MFHTIWSASPNLQVHKDFSGRVHLFRCFILYCIRLVLRGPKRYATPSMIVAVLQIELQESVVGCLVAFYVFLANAKPGTCKPKVFMIQIRNQLLEFSHL